MSSLVQGVSAHHIEALRAFNRFYTQRIGVLDRYLDSDFSLTEVRVLYELAQREQPTASGLVRDLGLDAGYLSRLLRRFEERSWITRSPSPHDARQSLLRMTRKGRAAFATLQRKSIEEAASLLAALAPAARSKLIAALQSAQTLLAGPSDPAHAAGPAVILRDLQPGDIGWVIQQHGEIYAREYGFNREFEALVAEVAARFIRRFDPDGDRGWIAEVDGERAGSVFVVRRSATVAQLRLLILTPSARGLGVGGQLVDACIDFTRTRGYRRLTLWTQRNLEAARAIYARRGFVLKASEANTAFGQELISETWELRL